MTLQRNHYEVLGVPRKATTDEIKKKYRELARKFHPDVVQDKAMGQKVFSQINQAYRILADPERRAQYDVSLMADATAAAAAARVRPSNGAGPGNGAAPQNWAGTQNGAGAKPLDAQQVANIARLVGEAETAFIQNEIGKVKAICEQVLKSDPRNQKALGLLGDALVQMGKPQEAAKAYRLALGIAPNFTIQAKLNRLTGTPPNGAASPGNGASPRVPPPLPPTNGAGASNANRTGQSQTDQGRADKPAGSLFSRLLGKK